MNAIACIGRTLNPKSVAIELFHVLSEAPEPFFDLGETREAAAFETEIGKWRNSRTSQVDRIMKAAGKIL